MNTNRCVKVFIIGGEENPCLPFIQSLAIKGLSVYVGSYRRVCPGFFSKYPVKRYLYPSPFVDPEGFMQEILSIVRKEKFKVTFVMGEQNSYLMTKYKHLFNPSTVLLLNDHETYIKCRNKKNTIKIAQQIGVPVPRTYFPDDEPIEEIADRLEYPVVLKPNISYGARGLVYPKSKDELIKLYYELKPIYDEYHIQEFVPPGSGQYKAEILLDKNLKLKAWCVYKKIRYYPPKGGSSTFNKTVNRLDILKFGEQILREIGWVGVGDCDFIHDPRDDTPKLMEINSRITRSIKICVLAGVDFPYLLYKMAIGEEIPQKLRYSYPIYMRYLMSDILWFLKSKERLRSNPSFFGSFYKGASEEIFSWNDPLPFLGFILAMGIEMFNPEARKGRLR